MSEIEIISIAATAAKIDQLYEEQDAADKRRKEAKNVRDAAESLVLASYEAIVRGVPRNLEEALIIAVAIGGNVFGCSLDQDSVAREHVDVGLSNLIKGLTSLIEPDKVASLPRWTRDT